ncbi:nacht and wd40 domain protein [Fusarium subglutinans]|uniref:Nacht and wd40 domain protein n=1 Tax=Gibberella subglutinans TaxID=42677 RepID=A0A8H5KX90_GIBSU|nr:nacht and wd40 domain protein [Fusarium subglutinans]KAF5580443.1 nacht and wd40 domain protein [Fusarium subglutinans]
MEYYLRGIPARIKRRLNKHGRTPTEEGNAPDLVDEHRAPTNQVQADLTSQLTPEFSHQAMAEPSNQPTVQLTDEVPDQSVSGSSPLVVAPTDTEVESSNPALESTDVPSGCSLWQQAYDKLCKEEDFESKLLQYEKYVLTHANVAPTEQTPATSYLEEVKTNQNLIQEWVRKELDSLSEQRVVIIRQGKQVVVRDKIHRVIKFIEKQKDLIKAGVAAEPTAALVWGGAMAIIPFLQNIFQQDTDAATAFEDICFLTLQSSVVERRLDELRQGEQQDSVTSSLLEGMEQEIINLYATSLRFQIRLIVHYQNGSLVRIGRDAVQADAWHEMLKDAQNANAKIAGGFTTLGSDRTLSELPAISDGVKALREQMMESADDTRLEQLTCVGAALFHSREVEDHGGCLEGTQVETLNMIQSWVEDPDAPFVFWLHGMAGTGKSSIALTVAQRLHKRKPFATSEPPHSSIALGATWFFNSNDRRRSSGANLVTSVARCLAFSVPRLRSHISKAIQDNLNVDNKSPGEQLRLLIRDPLLSLDEELFSPIRLLIVIDALDECSNAKEILQLVQNLSLDKTKVHIRILVTSRKEVYISKYFVTILRGLYRSAHLERIGNQNYVNHSHSLYALKESEVIDIDDISRFLIHTLSEIAIAQEWPKDWLNTDKIERLRKMSGGLFLCASVACRFLDYELDDEDLDGRLQLILDGGDEFRETDGHQVQVFKKILEYHYVGRDSKRLKRERHKAADEIRSILGTMSVLFRPVSIDSLGRFISKGRKDLKQQVAAFGAVVNIPEQDSGALTLIHLSFSEFLLSDQCPSDFRVYPEEVHGRILEKCIDLMGTGLYQDMCDLQHPGGRIEALAPSVVDRCIPQYLQYCCHHWIDHLGSLTEERRNVFLENDGFIHQFLREKFLIWLEALSLLRQIHVAILAMSRLQKMTEKADCPDLHVLVEDAMPFLRENSWIIERAPMQIYVSALLFSPGKSIIRKQFSQFMPRWIQVVSPPRLIWNPELLILGGSEKSHLSFAFSPDNTVLASAGYTGPVKLWDVATGIELQRLEFRESICCMAFSEDGKQIALGGLGEFLCVWEPGSNLMVELKGAEFRHHQHSIAISPKGDMIAATAKDGDDRIGLWLAIDGSQKLKRDLSGTPRAIQFAPGGQMLAIVVEIGYYRYSIQMWDVATDELKDLHVGTDKIWDVGFLDQGKTLASAINGTVVHWDTETWQESFRFSLVPQDEFDDLRSVAFSPNGAQYIAAQTSGKPVRLRLSTSGKEVGRFHVANGSKQLSLSSDGRYMASIIPAQFPRPAWETLIHLWTVTLDTASGDISDQEVPLESHFDSVYGRLEFISGADDLLLVEGGVESELWKWNTGGDVSKRVVPRTHSFSPNGRFLATWTEHRVQFWGATMEGQPFKEFEMPINHNVWHNAVFSTNADLVAIVGSSQTSIFETGTWQSVSLLQGDVSELVFSPLKDRVAWYSEISQTIHVWDISKGAHLFEGIKVQNPICEIFFSPNGELVLYVSNLNLHERRVHIVRVLTGQESSAFDITMWQITERAPVRFAEDSESVAAFGYRDSYDSWEYIIRNTSDGQPIGSLKLDSEHMVYGTKAAISPTQILGLCVSYRSRDEMQFWNSKGEKLAALDCQLPGDELRFSNDGAHIESQVGNLLVPRWSLQDTDASQSTQQEIPHECVLAHQRWITWGWDNILYLPPGYQTLRVTIKGKKVAFKTDKHGVVLMELDLTRLSIRERWTKLRMEE